MWQVRNDTLWIDRRELIGIVRVKVNMPVNACAQPSNYGMNDDRTRQQTDDPNHGRLAKVATGPDMSRHQGSGTHLECVTLGKKNLHRTPLVEVDGSMGECVNCKESKFVIRNNELQWVDFSFIDDSENASEPPAMSPHMQDIMFCGGTPCPGCPGMHRNPTDPWRRIAEDPGANIDNKTDRTLATLGVHLVHSGIDQISDGMMRNMHARLHQWVGWCAAEGDVSACESSVDSNEGEDEVRPLSDSQISTTPPPPEHRTAEGEDVNPDGETVTSLDSLPTSADGE